LARLNIKPSMYHMTVAGSQRAFLSGNLSRDRRVLPLYRTFVRKLRIDSCIVVPLVVRGQGIGELMFGSRLTEVFNNYDLQIAAIIGSQLAVAIENARYGQQSRDELYIRAEQAGNVSRIARELSVTTDLKELLRIIYDESIKITQANCGTVILFEPIQLDETKTRPTILMHLGHHPEKETVWAGTSVISEQEPVLLHRQDNSFFAPHEGIQCSS